ncbi:hypothetical protein GUITHDRAFT_109732 [Guillardia theta CCMP2712]|uniref:Uncharacterized protein n=2 Tax=Guillardia theta TaxID=55529 RepID=L1J7K2_GUITC|nr:hypothetical protein GUITHDRAFT_109732 [Guillardia theta CCMP2712]EKX44277.1 hypothetical protein GUITHDRAFT_109732 [Guillardia theta CCMP2712]|eukprot:XP_005831257.1 hypothetical protein GUITHDRAFT_109732 [Guillardia theta CCMP2712]
MASWGGKTAVAAKVKKMAEEVTRDRRAIAIMTMTAMMLVLSTLIFFAGFDTLHSVVEVQQGGRGSGGGFNWRAWRAQQRRLMRRLDEVEKGVDANSEDDSKSRDIKSVLSSLKDTLRPHPMPHLNTVPMDQELAILKVHKQMRTEKKFPKDRIEGAGDVTGIVAEQDRADERNALMEGDDAGPDTKTKHLFENCEDGSLTVEDAELCSRKALAIKMLTHAAVQSQLSNTGMSPMGSKSEPSLQTMDLMNDATSELIKDAIVGKEYLDFLHGAPARAKGGARKHLKKASHSAQSPSEEKDEASSKTSVRRHVTKSDALPKAEPAHPSAPSAHDASGRTQSAPSSPSVDDSEKGEAKKTARDSAEHHDLSAKKMSLHGDLPVLAKIADAAKMASKHSDASKTSTPTVDSKVRLEDLESQISSEEDKLAKEKMEFTKAMLKRQIQLQKEFSKSMKQIHEGLDLVDDFGGAKSSVLIPPEPTLYGSNSLQVGATAKNAANPSIAAVMNAIKQSSLFSVPKVKDNQGKGHHVSFEDKEKQVLKDALDRQFDEVASDGSASDKVRENHWQSPSFSELEPKEDIPFHAHKSKKAKLNQQKLRLLSSTVAPGSSQTHVGPATYRDLSTKATKYLDEALSDGSPTLSKATKDAMLADEKRGGATAELNDAEEVLCTVARLKKGLCSHRVGGRRMQGRGLRERNVVRASPSVATLAGDVAGNIEKFFHKNGMTN